LNQKRRSRLENTPEGYNLYNYMMVVESFWRDFCLKEAKIMTKLLSPPNPYRSNFIP
jgi:hypothetical protein